MSDRLQQQLDFLMEIDRLKSVNRQTLITDGTRRENTAEQNDQNDRRRTQQTNDDNTKLRKHECDKYYQHALA